MLQLLLHISLEISVVLDALPLTNLARFNACVGRIEALKERQILVERLVRAQTEAQDLPHQRREASNDTQHQVDRLHRVLNRDLLVVQLKLNRKHR